jgi:hypothetical protein
LSRAATAIGHGNGENGGGDGAQRHADVVLQSSTGLAAEGPAVGRASQDRPTVRENI